MTIDQISIVAILAAAVAMFLWGRWRHDMVALGALLAAVVAGVVPSDVAFAGFGHPAVITVAGVLVLSRGLQMTGAIDSVARRMLPATAGPTRTIALLTTVAAVLSAFMNNVGALALLMPVGIQVAAKQGLPPGRVLMPLAFGSILGGMTTLIGTPPNLIVSGFRAQAGAHSFAMFDFTPVGVVVALVGIAFVALCGWRLVPPRERAGVEGFETSAYLTDARVVDGSTAAGKTLREIERILGDVDAQIVAIVRGELYLSAPNPARIVRVGDILVIEAEPESLAPTLSSLALKLEEDVRASSASAPAASEADAAAAGAGARSADAADAAEDPAAAAEDEPVAPVATRRAKDAGDVVLVELAVLPDSFLIGRSATDVRLRTRYGINLLALSRQGHRSVRRLRSTLIEAGDVLLMQGVPEALAGFGAEAGCVPLAARAIRIPDKREALTALVVMAAAVAGAAFGLLPAAITFAGGALAFMALRVVPLRTVYDAIDWPVIVLLGALIPVAGALDATGAASVLARFLLEDVAQGHPVVALGLILVISMTLSDFMNNAATAAVLCPIAISSAQALGVRSDAFLMAVALGASCAFLTPIGHQNNTLILGPGGLHFGDFWRLGLPLELLVIAVGLPMLLVVWPL